MIFAILGLDDCWLGIGHGPNINQAVLVANPPEIRAYELLGQTDEQRQGAREDTAPPFLPRC